MKNIEKKKTSEIERLRKQHRKELKKTRPDLYQLDEEFRVKLDSCRNQDELEELMQWTSDQPLFDELQKANVKIVAKAIIIDQSIYEKSLLGMVFGAKSPLPMQLMALIEEMAVVCGTKAGDNLTWQTAKSAKVAYQKFLEAKGLPKSTRKHLEEAEGEYWGLLENLGRQLVFRGLEPFQGTAFDPLTWFVSLDEVIKANEAIPFPKLTVSKIRYYSRLGLLPKAIRLGEKGRAFYPPTIWPRLAIIHLMKEEGYTIEAIKAGLPIEIERNVTPWVRGWQFGYNLYAELVSPERESYVRMMEDRMAARRKT